MTFSIVGRCARTGQLGGAIASSSPAVAARCLWARAGVGAVVTQNVTDPFLGIEILNLLDSGRTAREAIDVVVRRTPHRAYRQLAVVDHFGGTASFSGEKTLGRYAVATGEDCVSAGNLLASIEIPQRMVDTFVSMRVCSLGERLVAALEAAMSLGGEVGPVHSAGLMVVESLPWPVTDLRVDWSNDPISELRALWRLWEPQASEYVARALHPEDAPPFGVPGEGSHTA